MFSRLADKSLFNGRDNEGTGGRLDEDFDRRFVLIPHQTVHGPWDNLS